MTDDDSRDTKTPDRQDEPTPDTQSSIETRLEHLDILTRSLLEDLERPDRTPAIDETDRRAVRRHILQIRAEASQAGLRLVGPEATMPYRPGADRDGPRRGGLVSSSEGPMPGFLESDPSSDEPTDDRRTGDHDRGGDDE
ncbi:hypothetical protein [Natrialba swarupiae]|uniref:hypothetical protein n=1 Tax=Natrialba swarupiae TaxID=2448032 RepID=UPI00192E4950|nr:hypothetical protein [Natrialba swarupiae]